MSTSPITYVPTSVLTARLSHSVDMGNGYGCEECTFGYYGCCPHTHSEESWADLWDGKYMECTESFIDSVCDSFDVPVCVWVRGEITELPDTLPGLGLEDKTQWVMGNGHHRVAVAINNGIPFVPVVFSFDGDALHREITDDDSRMDSSDYREEEECSEH